MNTYWCPKCRYFHHYESKIGQHHLKICDAAHVPNPDKSKEQQEPNALEYITFGSDDDDESSEVTTLMDIPSNYELKDYVEGLDATFKNKDIGLDITITTDSDIEGQDRFYLLITKGDETAIVSDFKLNGSKRDKRAIKAVTSKAQELLKMKNEDLFKYFVSKTG